MVRWAFSIHDTILDIVKSLRVVIHPRKPLPPDLSSLHILRSNLCLWFPIVEELTLRSQQTCLQMIAYLPKFFRRRWRLPELGELCIDDWVGEYMEFGVCHSLSIDGSHKLGTREAFIQFDILAELRFRRFETSQKCFLGNSHEVLAKNRWYSRTHHNTYPSARMGIPTKLDN